MSTINNSIPFVPENTTDPAAGLNLLLNQIDALLQVRVHTVGENAPPAGVEGQRHIVGTGPTGAWVGQADKLARFLDGAWSFYSARIVLGVDGVLYVRPASVWLAFESGGADWGAIGGLITDQSDLVAALDLKVDKVTGKQLSTEDFTITEKNKLSGIATAATANATDAALRDRASHTGAQAATTVSVADAGNYFAGTNAETVLQEVGALIGDTAAALDTINGVVI